MTTTTTLTIDCQTCPARGRLCGDCFVPVLGQSWLQDGHDHGDGPRNRPDQGDGHRHAPVAAGTSRHVPLDSDELAAVSAFVRAGLVDPREADRASAELTRARRSAVG